MCERERPKVLRYIQYTEENDPLNYYRTMLLLFLPWRNELEDTIKGDISRKYINNRDSILKLKSSFENLSILSLSKLIDTVDVDERECNTSHLSDDVDIVVGNLDLEFSSLINESEYVTNMMCPQILKKSEYYNLMSSLNIQQREYVMSLLAIIKNNSTEQLLHCVGGGAGVGKSTLISALFQCLSRVYLKRCKEVDPSPILLTAYTGKAAHNIQGMTLHSTFALSVTQNG